MTAIMRTIGVESSDEEMDTSSDEESTDIPLEINSEDEEYSDDENARSFGDDQMGEDQNDGPVR